MKVVLVGIMMTMLCSSAQAQMPGQESVIAMKMTGACLTKNYHDDWVNAEVAGDMEGITELVLSGRCFLVKQGERVLVIESSWTLRKVRMRSGPYKGRAGWVYMEAVK